MSFGAITEKVKKARCDTLDFDVESLADNKPSQLRLPKQSKVVRDCLARIGHAPTAGSEDSCACLS